jgi:hypothetical protein
MVVGGGGGLFSKSKPQTQMSTRVQIPVNTSVAFIQVGPPGYFVHIAMAIPIVSALKNYYI